jgi:hypothetical protein
MKCRETDKNDRALFSIADLAASIPGTKAFSSEVGTGSRQENASNQKI